MLFVTSSFLNQDKTVQPYLLPMVFFLKMNLQKSSQKKYWFCKI